MKGVMTDPASPLEPPAKVEALLFTANLSVTATLHLKPGSRRAMELELRGGARLRGLLLPQVPRLPEGFGGTHRVRLYPRTTKDGRLEPNVGVARVLKPGANLEAPDGFTFCGKVVRLDRAEGLAILRIFPNRPGLEPFVVSCQASLEVMNAGVDAFSVKMTGRIGENLRLVAETLEPVHLPTPDAFKDWVPPMKRQRPAVPLD
jgi:hypothetical protein